MSRYAPGFTGPMTTAGPQQRGGFGQQQPMTHSSPQLRPMTQPPIGPMSTAVQQGMSGMGGGFGQPTMPRQPMTNPGMGGGFGQPPSAARSYLDAVQQYKQSGSQGRQPLYTDFRRQPGMGGQPPMPPQLPGGGVMDRIKQLGGMGAMSDYFGAGAMDPRLQNFQQQPGMGGMDDTYQQFLTERQQYGYGGGQPQQPQQGGSTYIAIPGTAGGLRLNPQGMQQQGGYGPGISNYSAPQPMQQGGQPTQTVQQLGSQPPAARRPMADYRQLLGQTPWTGGQFNPQGQQQQKPMTQPPMAQPKPLSQQSQQQLMEQMRPANPMMPQGMNMGGSVGMAPPNPYAQQVGQEDPRMQAMRNMQMMNFGG